MHDLPNEGCGLRALNTQRPVPSALPARTGNVPTTAGQDLSKAQHHHGVLGLIPSKDGWGWVGMGANWWGWVSNWFVMGGNWWQRAGNRQWVGVGWCWVGMGGIGTIKLPRFGAERMKRVLGVGISAQKLLFLTIPG